MTLFSRQEFRAPRRASAIGMWLFLAALSMLFISGMLLYVLMRFHVFGRAMANPVILPPLTWISTAVLILGSLSVHFSVVNIRLERQTKFRRYFYLTAGLAALFLAIQFPCLMDILREHRQIAASVAESPSQMPGQQIKVPLQGLVFCLILLHALHVIGGIVAMGIVAIQANRGAYDHEHYSGVEFAARYWHFLDVVWICMFTTFLIVA